MFFTPRVDVAEKESQYLISTELPGVKKDNISISLENGILSIEAENSEKKPKKKTVKSFVKKGATENSYGAPI
jgi:HSP20 family protein